MGWGSSTRRGGGRKLRARPRNFVFLGFRREESGMSREFCRDVPDPWRCSKSLCKKTSCAFFVPYRRKEVQSGKKKEPKPKLFGPDNFGWGGGLPREAVGAEKFGRSLETREIKLFWRDIPGFCRDIPEVPEKFEKKKFVFNFRSLSKQSIGRREKTPIPKTRFSIWTLLRTSGRFTTRPLPVHFTTKMSVVRPFSVLSKDEVGP